MLFVLAAPLLWGYAASFQIEPIVNQEFVISVEDVETASEGGPEESADEPIGYLLGTDVVAIAPPPSEPACNGEDACHGDDQDPPAEPIEPEDMERAVDEEPEPLLEHAQPVEYEAHDGFAWILPAQ
jgi:hypothetical protein